MPGNMKSVYSFNLSFSDFISLQSKNFNTNFIFLVDSQADISLIKISIINKSLNINTNEIINITGITPNTKTTLGTIHLNFCIYNIHFCQKFYVVEDDFNIPSDGILGKDFV